jgi:dTDP-4-dehydrorhamnose reductase
MTRDGGWQRGEHSARRYRAAVRLTRRSRLMLVTGGGGFLGRHVLRAASDAGWQVVAPPSRQLDVCDRARVLAEIPGWKPTVVVHLAYRKDRRTIVAGTANVADAARAADARLVHLSTDVVFAGRSAPYAERDAPEALNDYGRWKGEAERTAGGGLVLRTSLLYGTDVLGHCQRDVQAALEGKSSTVFFTDEFRCPTYAGDVAAAIVLLAGRPEITGPLHVAGPQALSRYELARRFAEWMGYDPDAVRAGTAAGSNRPAHVVLDCALAASIGIRCRPIDAVLR